jgi:FkbH-like protein
VIRSADYHRLAREIEADAAGTFHRLAVLSTFTAELLRPFLVVECQQLGSRVLPWFGPFQQLEQMVLDPASPLWQQSPDVLWIALRLEDVDRYLPYEAPELGPQRTLARLDAIRERLIGLARAAREKHSASILVSNLALPSLDVSNLFDANGADGFVHLLAECNRRLAGELAAVVDAHVFDYVGVVAQSGSRGWSDPKLWYMARTGGSADSQIVLARAVARCVCALIRPAAKCIVVDLDNTLWGGVLGDDGLEGIQLGDDYPGNVFKDFQAALLGLRRRGFLLAIASKNDEATVLEALASHPEMLLRREHFAALAVNWGPKPEGLRKVAETLNIGLDSLIFIDDNPVERAQVRAELPQVHVVELPPSPLGYLEALRDVALLDRPRLLDEDRQRAAMYESDARRQEVQQKTTSVEGFLRELDMVAEVGLANGKTLERVHQLVQKTNQFNLTTRRHKLDALRRLMDSPDAEVAWLRLRDRYGDLGLVCVGIIQQLESEAWAIDTLLMSCRVMGRHVEDAFLAYLADLARGHGAIRLRGSYAETAKNRPVRDFYPEHGFVELSAGPGERTYEARLAAEAFPWPVAIRRLEPAENVHA